LDVTGGLDCSVDHLSSNSSFSETVQSPFTPLYWYLVLHALF
jgi:hypothetical protein